MNLYVFLILYYQLNLGLLFKPNTFIQDKYHELRKKIGKIINTKKENALYININEYEYPRGNETLQQIHKEQWSDYYKCLKMRFSQISSEKTLPMMALVALEGTSITLKCQICVSPAEISEAEIVDWYHSTNHDNFKTEKFVEYSENTVVFPDDYRLTMYNVHSGHIGRYWCKMGDTLGGMYYLDVDQSQNASIVRPNEAPASPHAELEQTIPKYNLRVYTTWTRWSSCSACDLVGQKIRYGYCTISMLENSAEIITEQEKKGTTAKNQQAKNGWLIRNILRIFENKLPCRSFYTPENIQNLPEIKRRKTEIMFRYCKQSCPKNLVFEIRDKKGNVIESANNSAGIYSLVQGIPKPPPSITRVTLYKKHNKKAQLKCPGNLNTDVLITWRIGNKRLIPSVIEKQSGGRIHINSKMHIIFEKLKFIDSNIYSCWQNNDLTGTIKLNVTEEIEVRLDHHIFMIGAIAIISVFIIVFWKAFKGRKRFTIH